MTGDRRLRDGIDRALVGAGVIFGNDNDQRRHDKADNAAQEEVGAGDLHTGHRADRAPAHRRMGGNRKTGNGEDAGGDQALVECAHDGIVGAKLDEEGAGNRRQDAGAANRQRIDHGAFQYRRSGKKIAARTMVATTETA